MFLAIKGILTPAEAQAARDMAAGLTFQDGRKTAGAQAARVKTNDQAAPSPDRDALLTRIQAAIVGHPVFASAARPRHLTPLILSRYRKGQTYGMHVDNAIMSGLRTDLSFTLFLCDPASYEGGALEIEDSLETRQFRLEAGDMILYPSTTLHRVTPVTRGERVAVVGWVESWIRDPGEREILFDLDRSIASLEPGPVLDQLTKVRSNLLRRWAGA